MQKGALGLIETYGYVGAVEAADVALKSANVTLEGYEIVKGGLVMIKIKGDVAAVKAAVEAAELSLERLNIKASTYVIPRPADETWVMLNNSPKREIEPREKIQNNKKSVDSEKENEQIEYKDEQVENIEIQDKEEIASIEQMTVDELRKLARKLSLSTMTNKQIKFAKKDKLLEEIRNFYQRRDS